MLITFYAGAADAAGVPTTELDAGALTAEELVRRLGQATPPLVAVLPKCSLLVDGRVVTDDTELIAASARVDILPPFAGG